MVDDPLSDSTDSNASSAFKDFQLLRSQGLFA
jgi:hypothetical protein